MSKKILLVDDMETVLLFEKSMLHASDIQIRTAKNGMKALEEVAKDPPDLILLDIMMPEINGIEVCKRLKADPETRDIPIVMVTTRDEADMVEQAFKAGCDDYITKPLDRMELLSKVRAFLG